MKLLESRAMKFIRMTNVKVEQNSNIIKVTIRVPSNYSDDFVDAVSYNPYLKEV